MRSRTIFSLTTLFVASSTTALFAQPLPSKMAGYRTNRPPENQSVSGKISSIGDAAFKVRTTVKDDQQPQIVEFLVDDETKVEGKLKVGAQAVVEYRSESGRNIAVHVVVTSTSGANPSI